MSPDDDDNVRLLIVFAILAAVILGVGLLLRW